jgi:predicted pyridoxine 5'-phosphate oxidase superfamily flavin-nucleotide-binding protein
MNYAKLAFSEPIKALQKEQGSRPGYERMEQSTFPDGLSYRELNFIKERDSFYVASFGENGFPYIQHRGGPKGFLKVIDLKTLAFLDFRGNKQYITTGNVQTHNKVSLILVDYPNRARLKIYAEAEVVSLSEQPELEKKLELEDYKYKAERIFLFHIKAFDWNCPQHITPRYTVEDISKMVEEKNNYIENLRAEIKALQEKSEGCGPQ